jgi:perosamine synthetase
VALDIALKIIGVGSGDEVIVPAMTYIATAAAVSYQHAAPVFVDIEPESFNLDPDKIEAAISTRTRGIIFIDYGGNPADIDAIKAVAEKHDLFLLQDAAQNIDDEFSHGKGHDLRGRWHGLYVRR